MAWSLEGRAGLAVRYGGAGTSKVPGVDDFNQLVDSLVATKQVLADIVGGQALYSGGAAGLSDLTGGHTLYPAFRAILVDAGGVPWLLRANGATAIEFAVTDSASANLYLEPVTTTGGGSSAAALGRVTDFKIVAVDAGSPVTSNAILLGTGAVASSAFTSYTPADTAPGAPLVGAALPPGGAARQALVKASGDDGDAVWDDLTATDVGADPAGTASGAIAALGLGDIVTHDAADFDAAGTAGAVQDNLDAQKLGDHADTVFTPVVEGTSQALVLPGGSNWVDLGVDPLKGHVHGAAAVWFKQTGSYTTYAALLGSRMSGAGYGGWGIEHVNSAGDYYKFMLQASSDHATGNAAISHSNWHRLLVQRAPYSGADRLEFYVDGSLVGTAAASEGTAIADSGQSLTLGWMYSWNAIVGVAQEVCLLADGYLDTAAIAADYAAGAGVRATVGSPWTSVFHLDGALDDGATWVGGGSPTFTTGHVPGAGTGPSDKALVTLDLATNTWKDTHALSVAAGVNLVPLADPVSGKLDGSWLPGGTSGDSFLPLSRVVDEATAIGQVPQAIDTGLGAPRALHRSFMPLGLRLTPSVETSLEEYGFNVLDEATGVMWHRDAYGAAFGRSYAPAYEHWLYGLTQIGRTHDAKYGHPISGATYSLGTTMRDKAGAEWYCASGGDPGTWVQLTPGIVSTWSDLTTAANWNGGALLSGYRAIDTAFPDITWTLDSTFGWKGRIVALASTVTTGSSLITPAWPNSGITIPCADFKYLPHDFCVVAAGSVSMTGFDASNYTTVRLAAYDASLGTTFVTPSVSTITVNSNTRQRYVGAEPTASGDVIDLVGTSQLYFRAAKTGSPTVGTYTAYCSAYQIHR